MILSNQGADMAASPFVWEGKWHMVYESRMGQIESQGIVAKTGDGFSPGYQTSVNMDDPVPCLFPAVNDVSVATNMADSLSRSQYAVNAFLDLQKKALSSLKSSIPPGFARSAVEARADSISLLTFANEHGVDSTRQVLDYLKLQTQHAVDTADKRSMSSLNEVESVLKTKPEYFATSEAAHANGMAIGLRGANADKALSLSGHGES